MNSPTELQERWQHSDPDIRLQAIEELATDAQGGTVQQLFVQIASSDPDTRVRSAAAHRITDLQLLEQLCQQTRQKDKAVYKFCKDRLLAAQQLEAEQTALQQRRQQLCHSLETLASKATGPLTGAQHQYLLGQWREVAAEADPILQEKVQSASTALAAQIEQFASQRNHEIELQQSVEQLRSGLTSAESFFASLHAPIAAEQMQLLEHHINELTSLLAAFPAKEAELADTATDQQPKELVKQCRDMISRLSAGRDSWQQLEARAGAVQRLQNALDNPATGNSSHESPAKHHRALADLQKRYDKLLEIPWPENFPSSALHQQLKAMQPGLAALRAKNAEWQQKHIEELQASILLLNEHIEQGHLSDAQKSWERIHSALNQMGEQARHPIQEQLAPSRAKLTELQDWKNFAATEKKKELIDRMQQLLDGSQSPPQKAKSIRALQDDWKKLGHTDDSDKLWTQFNELAHKAFEPCKEYFKERKEILGANLKERNRICEELEQFIAAASPETLNVGETGKLESSAQEEWKKYAPVAQNKIKNLQKRFNGLLNTLRQLKRKALQHNAELKLALIARAEKLLELENFQEAIAEAKKLQNEWKAIGPSPYKDDRNHWNAFRQACDKLFNRRDEQAKQQKTEARKVVSAARDTLKKISNLLTLDDEAFLQSKKQFAELKETFYSQLNPDMKAERRQLIEQLEGIGRKYESRQRAAPDLKSLQLMNQLRAHAEFCAGIEQAVTRGEVPAEDSLRQQWEELESIGNADLAQTMDKRFRQLCQCLGDQARLQKLASENEIEARELCVEMEIQAGIDTPATDKALRMKIQLNHLKQDFGRKLNAGRSKAQVLADLEMQFLCIGPLQDNVRQALQLRINGIRAGGA